MKSLKKLFFITLLFFTLEVYTLKSLAYVDTDYILSTKIPDFVQAEEKMNDFTKQWQSEIEAAYAEVDQMYRDYQSEQVLLTNEMKLKEKKLLFQKKNLYNHYNKNIFGQKW